MLNLTYGVGINDADYSISNYSVSGSKKHLLYRCNYFSAWKGMLMRCYSEKYKSKKPTYLGCSVCEEWLTFSNFKKWMENQDWHGKQLDKDILCAGNKIYSPDNCCFVSAKLNNFLTSSGATRGEYLIGASFHAKKKAFEVRCSNPFTGKIEYLGAYSDDIQAHKAWAKRKSEIALMYAEIETNEKLKSSLVELSKGFLRMPEDK
jgi:hypothetical protein